MTTSTREVLDPAELLADVVFCVNNSAQLFERFTPEHMFMLVWCPAGEDGFAAAEIEGRDIPACRAVRRAIELGTSDRRLAAVALVRAARLGGPSAPTTRAPG